jgi:beclin 1
VQLAMLEEQGEECNDDEDDNGEAELQQLLREEADLERQEAALKSRLERGRRQAVAIRAEEQELLEQRNTLMALQESRMRRLQQHQKFRVHEDLFSIARDGEFPVINGFRLGSSPSMPIEWEEINAALGEAALLLHVCASKLSFQFRTYRPVAIGNVSRMEQVGGAKEAYMLAGSFRTAVMSSQFNTALGALLAATDQMAQAVGRKFNVAPPYKVTSDMIGDAKGDWYSVKRPMRDSAKWVRALLYLLGELKWLLSIVVSADTRPPTERAATVVTPNPPKK